MHLPDVKKPSLLRRTFLPQPGNGNRLNRDKEEKGIVAGQRLGTSASGGGPSAGLKRETFAANNPFLLHVVVHVLEGVKAKVPSPQLILNLG
ncbi:unnamed protein product [Boreogadus saida]